MLSKELGRTGVMIPEVGLGTWNYRVGPEPLRRGLEEGALFVDTAESYGTEPVVGKAISGLRERVFLATKVSPENFRPEDLKKSADASLRRLGIEIVDLLQLHHPNPSIPLAETLGALGDLIDAGKVRFAGVSNFSIPQLEQARKALGKHPLVSNQMRYNVIDRTIENGMLQYCQANGITVIAYSPLSKGLSRILDCDPTEVLADLSRNTGKSVAQIVLNWCLAKERVVVIPAGNSVEHILENCGAAGWRLTPEQIALVDSRIQFRRRSRFDQMVRKYMPAPLQKLAVGALSHLPRSLRRRLT